MQDEDDGFELNADDLDAWEAEPLGSGFEGRVMDAVPPAQGQVAARRWLLPLTLAVTAAAAALVVVALDRLGPEAAVAETAVEAIASRGAAYEIRGARSTQLSGSVRYVVPSGTPFVVSTPAADVVVGGTDFTVEMLSMNDKRRRTWMGAAALALGGAAVAVYVHDGNVRVENDHGAKSVRAGGVAVASEHTAPRDEPVAKAKKAAAKPKTRRLSAAQRKDVVRRLNAAAKARSAASEVGEAPDETSDDAEPVAYGTLQKDYIQEVVSEDLVPILQECYASALEDAPELGGKLVLEFSIVGDESVGGIVEEVELSQELSTLKNPALEECMAESATTLLFDPPEGGGRVSISYPFVFAPGEDEPAE